MPVWGGLNHLRVWKGFCQGFLALTPLPRRDRVEVALLLEGHI